MSGIILLPTLNRIALMNQFLDSYEKTNATISGFILVDSEDLARNADGYAGIKNRLPANWEIRDTGTAVSMGDKVRFIFPELCEYKFVGLLNDDHYCVTSEWDKKVEAMIDGTNMVSTNDGNWNFGFNVVGLTAWSQPLLEACGFPIFPPGINHWFIDNVWKAIGESTGCWLETMTVNIEHRHAFIGKMAQDETFKLSQDQGRALQAKKAFEEFMEKDFKEVCLKVMVLRKAQLNGQKFT